MHKVLGTAALTTVICCLAAPALAASGASIAVSPSSQHAGGSVQVSGSCEAGTSGFAISRAFLHDATHDFAGVGAVPFTTDSRGHFATTAMISSAAMPGSYTVSARCGGGNIGVTATVVVTSGVERAQRSRCPPRCPPGPADWLPQALGPLRSSSSSRRWVARSSWRVASVWRGAPGARAIPMSSAYRAVLTFGAAACVTVGAGLLALAVTCRPRTGPCRPTSASSTPAPHRSPRHRPAPRPPRRAPRRAPRRRRSPLLPRAPSRSQPSGSGVGPGRPRRRRGARRARRSSRARVVGRRRGGRGHDRDRGPRRPRRLGRVRRGRAVRPHPTPGR